MFTFTPLLRKSAAKPGGQRVARRVQRSASLPASRTWTPLPGLPLTTTQNGARPTPGALQAKLIVQPVGAPLEHEADQTAERVMGMPEPDGAGVAGEAVQRKCATCSGEEELQRKGTAAPGLSGQAPGPSFATRLSLVRASGGPLSAPVRSFMEPRFQADFSRVRLHTDARAGKLNEAINARAFTVGRDVFVKPAEFRPETYDGRKLIAHELAHVVQQGSSSGVISRKPPTGSKKKRGPGFFHGCHKVTDHKHAPKGDWAKRQAAWKKSCGAAGKALEDLVENLAKGKFSPSSIRARPVVECICGNTDPASALEAARRGTMFPGGLASDHIDHYLEGGGADFEEDLRALLLEDEGVRKQIAKAIKIAPRGCVFISQDDYSTHDWKFALGGIDRMDYQVDSAAGTVHLSFKDRYEWHPEDKGRPSNCVHIAAVELKASGAADFWMIGDAIVPLDWFTTGPSLLDEIFG